VVFLIPESDASVFFCLPSSLTYPHPLSLPDALPIGSPRWPRPRAPRRGGGGITRWSTPRCPLARPPSTTRPPTTRPPTTHPRRRSEEHTSELQSLRQLVCRLLLEKKKTENNTILDWK